MSNRILGHSIGGVPVAWGIDTIALAGGRIFYVDPVSGADGNSGRDPDAALLTIQAAHDVTTTAKNDIIVLIAAATANEPAATIAWDHTYTHMVGACAPMLMGQRARIVGTAALDLSPVVTITGRGCYFANIKFSNDKDADTAGGCVYISTSAAANCSFKNCSFDITSATALARTDTYSLRIVGASECYFDTCSFGSSSSDAAGAGYNVSIEEGAMRTVFKDCYFQTRATSSTSRVMVRFVTSTTAINYTLFDNCTFINTSTNHLVTMTDCFSVTGNATYGIVVKGNCQIVGITGWSDTTTYVYVPNFTTTAVGASQTPVA
jgi:hypothetical protein